MDNSEVLGIGLLGLVAGLALGTRTGNRLLTEILQGLTYVTVTNTRVCKHPIMSKKKKSLPRCLICGKEMPKLAKGKVVN